MKRKERQKKKKEIETEKNPRVLQVTLRSLQVEKTKHSLTRKMSQLKNLPSQ